jgi:hypothetical protein
VIVKALELKAVANVRARKSPDEVFGGLVGIRPFGVDVVYQCAHLCALVDIAGEVAFQAFLYVLLATRRVVRYLSEGYARVVPLHGRRGRYPFDDGVTKEKIAHRLALHPHRVDALGAEVAGASPCRRNHGGY